MRFDQSSLHRIIGLEQMEGRMDKQKVDKRGMSSHGKVFGSMGMEVLWMMCVIV